MKSILIVCFMLALALPTVGAGPVDEFQDFSDIQLEELLNQPVVTASRYSQKISESPSTVTVITAEEIEASAARSIPDLLRMVPGMEVFSTTASDFSVSARGFNGLLANMMLVLVDGRTVYQDFYGIILWESLAVVLDEIESIEIIRGPGSAMYGANAFNGVINIITRKPAEIDKTYLTAEGGEGEYYRSSIIHAGKYGASRYKILAGVKGSNSWEDDEAFSNKQTRVAGAVSRTLNESSSIDFEGGYTEGIIELYPDPSIGNLDVITESGGVSYLKANYRSGDFSVQMFRNYLYCQTVPKWDQSLMPESKIRELIFDLDLQHSFVLADRHRVVWGGSYRNAAVEWPMLQGAHKRDLFAGFIHDEYKPHANWILYFGGRFDKHPLTDEQISPRGGLIFTPKENHALRISLGTAFRNPTEMETHWYLAKELAPGLDYVTQGSEHLKPEKIASLEVGYRAPFAKFLIADINLFVNQVEGLIDFETTRYLNDVIPIEQTFANGDKVDVCGGEAAFDFLFSERLVLKANYSYLRMTDAAADTALTTSPEHKLNIALTCKVTPQLQLNLQYHLTSEIRFAWNQIAVPMNGRVPVSGLVNGNLTFRFSGEAIKIWVAGYNLLDNVHRQFPVTEEVRRRLYLGMQVGF